MVDIDKEGMTFDGAKNGLASSFALYSGDAELLPISLVDQMLGIPNTRYKGLARVLGTGLGPIGLGFVRSDPRKIIYGVINLVEGLYQTIKYQA